MRTPTSLLFLLGSSVLLGCGGDGAEEPLVERSSVLLVTLDTTRADAMSFMGTAPVGLTPNLDALAARGIVHTAAHTVAPLTLPAHASMLTGLYPPRHGIRDNGQSVLPSEAQTLAEAARGAGYQTAAFVAAVVLEEGFGLGQGFDVYGDDIKDVDPANTHVAERPGSETVAEAIEWLNQRDPERPFFLWVHLFEPHHPYLPPIESAVRAGGDQYLGEVARGDELVGELLERLASEGLTEGTTVLFVSDHGESLNEHGELSHGVFTYQASLRVPLVLARADGARAGTYSDALVSVADVGPTLADAMGVSLGSGLDGVSLWDGAPGAERGVYFECYSGWLSMGWSPLAGWMDRAGKYHHSSTPELYDWVADPGETTNLVERRDAEPYRRALAAVYERPALVGAGGSDDEGVSEETLARIRALGYAGTGANGAPIPHPLEHSDRPSPHLRAGELGGLLRAADALAKGRLDEARVLYAQCVAVNPNSLRSLEGLTNSLVLLNLLAESLQPLQQRIALDGGRPTDHYHLGLALATAGRTDEAMAAFRHSLDVSTTRPEWLDWFQAQLRGSGLAAEADALDQRFPRR